jgi:hypothetical protein
MNYKSVVERRDPYGYSRKNDTSYTSEMGDFMASGKRLITYWAENIRPFKDSYMPYNTFRHRTMEYLKQNNIKLPSIQKERVKVPDDVFQGHAIKYLILMQSGRKINIAQYYESYIIVPPYDSVPSYDQFKKNFNPFLKQQLSLNACGIDMAKTLNQMIPPPLTDHSVLITLLDQSSDVECVTDTIESATEREREIETMVDDMETSVTMVVDVVECYGGMLSHKLRKQNKTICYNEVPLVSKVSVAKQGYGVIADCDIPPSTILFPYGGQVIKDFSIIQRKLSKGNNKILQVRNQALWLDGETSKTLGPMLNHACDCISNCEITWERQNAYVTTKSSMQGDIKNGVELTFDYNYDTADLINNQHMQWYIDYNSTHTCNTTKAPSVVL